MNSDSILNSELNDILEGLKSIPKKIPSKYFYDEVGDDLFIEITKLPEYYLTRVENSILESNASDILNQMNYTSNLRVLELGAGNGIKANTLLKNSLDHFHNIIYSPLDISSNAISLLISNMKNNLPDLILDPIICDYNEIKIKTSNLTGQKLLLYLGSNLGNYTPEESKKLLNLFSESLNKGDFFLLGIDLVKHPDTIYKAYNDSKGLTSKFNLNLLNRMNQILGTNFDETKFFHYPLYNPYKNQAESYLISNCDQTIYSSVFKEKFHFFKFEAIRTEISRKFHSHEIVKMAMDCSMTHINNYFDSEETFCCTLWRK
jgi:L-histidine Nalpha-methyltransferase